MAEQIEDFSGDLRFCSIVQKIRGLEKINIMKNPNKEILEKDMSRTEIIKYQSEITAQCIGHLSKFAKEHMENEGQKQILDELVKKNYFVTRLVQKWADDEEERAKGLYFDPTRETITTIPATIENGQVNSISDSALKLIGTFQGDTDSEAEKLGTFLHSVFDVAVTNNLNESTVIKVLKRKLENTARKLIKRFETKFANNGQDPPSLKQIVIKLEDRFCTEYQPEIASARLSVYTKGPNQSYQALEADICELTELAARAEEAENRPQWITQKEIAVFKQAVSDQDRKLLYNENQNRKLSGIPHMTMSDMVDFLTKTYSERNAFITASNLKSQHKIDDFESVQKIKDQDKGKEEDENYQDENDEYDGESDEYEDDFDGMNEEQIKEELFAIYKSKKNQQFQQEKYNNNDNTYQNNTSNRHNGNSGRSRKFVTAEMVNTDVGCCFKCNSNSHKFTEAYKCIYGQDQLLSSPCLACGVGGHHFSVCIKNQKKGGSPRPKEQEQLNQKELCYQDMNKNIPERFPKDNDYEMPSLFQW